MTPPKRTGGTVASVVSDNSISSNEGSENLRAVRRISKDSSPVIPAKASESEVYLSAIRPVFGTVSSKTYGLFLKESTIFSYERHTETTNSSINWP